MKVVLMTSDYYLSAKIAVHTFLEHPLLKKHGIEVVGVVSASAFHLDKRSFQVTLKLLRQSGLRFFVKHVGINIIQAFSIWAAKWFVAEEKRKYFAIDELAKRHNIPYLEIKNINSEGAKKFIKKCKPDLLVSCLLLQIVKKDILDIPEEGAINFHPSLTQKHRGIFASFWALLRGWQKTGATIHYMTEKVDDGEIILQKHFFVHPSDTIHSLNNKSAELGGNLLARAVAKIKKKKHQPFLLKKFGSIFSMPSSQETRKFKKKGKKYLHFGDLFSV